jgi:hypothetical protein
MFVGFLRDPVTAKTRSYARGGSLDFREASSPERTE